MLNNGNQILINLLNLYSLVLIVRIVMSWIPNVDRSNQLVKLLYQVTDPVLEPVRRAIPPMGGIDISPILVFFAIRLLQGFLA